MTQVLVVDDEPAMRRTLSLNLRARGYEVEVAGTGEEALARLRAGGTDLVLLDLGLPDLGGLEVLARLRAWSQVPVIVVSARHASEEKVAALDAGADDYVTKPVGVDELLARIRAAVRRVPEPERVVEAGELRIDLDARRVSVAGETVRLTPTEWRILDALVSRPGRLVPQGELLRTVWGPAYEKETNYLRVYLSTLRRKLEADPSRPRHLVTEPGMGYRFVP
ncbi:response regulator [Nocardioides campestrisoli]|uniref:response regulator n=1 Tax=Nocardioides campestrisoli TaxID=2736757 RepID=UPI0015E716BB|nr:response regulator transcription factor [Nocardioides campestrisoli]